MVSSPLLLLASLACLTSCRAPQSDQAQSKSTDNEPPLAVPTSTLKSAKYIDLTHSITPSIPVWPGFGPATFGPRVDPKTKAVHLGQGRL